MHPRLHAASTLLFIIASLVLSGCGQQSQTVAPTAPPTIPPSPPTHWVAQADNSDPAQNYSWSFSFTIDATDTTVIALSVDFPAHLVCDHVFANVAPDKEEFSGSWPIALDASAKIVVGLNKFFERLTISGQFGHTPVNGIWSLGLDSRPSEDNCGGYWSATQG